MTNPSIEQAIYWLTGAVGAPLIDWLKRRLGLSGPRALWLTVGMSIALAAAALALNGALAPAVLTPEMALQAFAQVIAAATLAYKLLLADKAAGG
jgi:hypothetical protein